MSLKRNTQIHLYCVRRWNFFLSHSLRYQSTPHQHTKTGTPEKMHVITPLSSSIDFQDYTWCTKRIPDFSSSIQRMLIQAWFTSSHDVIPPLLRFLCWFIFLNRDANEDADTDIFFSLIRTEWRMICFFLLLNSFNPMTRPMTFIYIWTGISSCGWLKVFGSDKPARMT